MLKSLDKIALVACSDGLKNNISDNIANLIKILKDMGLNPVLSPSLYEFNNHSYSAYDRANDLINFYQDQDIKAIFDISGGDLSNEILDYLDFDIIKSNYKPFFGYSDLTVILNSLYSKNKTINYNYQLRNLINDNGQIQINRFKNFIINEEQDLFNFDYTFINGNEIDGIVLGGNIRCLLKLSGTKYMPNFNNSILFLEAQSGNYNKISTYITQLKQLGIFNSISGLILGTFTEFESKKENGKIEELFINTLKKLNIKNLPIIKTTELGHGSNSKAIPIGGHIRIV
ncbi:S66 peptidase family protein [Clostridium sp.]|uniref:S66 family peptidase n=1 Tax=Clostridium sp. TaxID=1506 RepID=UPI002633D0D7|nr:S66 peptidase family protein [Clostridium sp.]